MEPKLQPSATHTAPHSALALLREIQSGTLGPATTKGLSDQELLPFLATDPTLVEAIQQAHRAWQTLLPEQAKLAYLDEADEVRTLQAGFLNFYAPDEVNPYVALAAKGPWIVTSRGAVVHDSGGYGMLGLGHAPPEILEVLARPQVMANIMTASTSQLRFMTALRRHIGQSRSQCPYASFVCLNSGSEAMSLALRITDVHAKAMTLAGARAEGRSICGISLAGSFHGRTDRPARFSHSTRGAYREALASFRAGAPVLTVPANDRAALSQSFEQAEAEGVFIESLLLEPVMGEGNPGYAIEREFYDLARDLTRQHGALLIVDSIQAGLRAHGVLSITDYPGFEDCEPPDMESYSKALNAGQYPLSVLALGDKAAGTYQRGLYGNTMTTNPRALEVGTTVLAQITPELRENIRQRGVEFVRRLQQLARELGQDRITAVQGCGLLVSCQLGPKYTAYGAGSVEEWLRRHGVGVIHGGSNCLRFTPHFRVSSEELALVVEHVRESLLTLDPANKGSKHGAAAHDPRNQAPHPLA